MMTCKAVWPNYSYKNNKMTFTHSHTYKWLLSGGIQDFFSGRGCIKTPTIKTNHHKFWRCLFKRMHENTRAYFLFVYDWVIKERGFGGHHPPPLNYQPVCLSSTLGNWWLNVWFLRPTWRSDAGSGLLPSIAENLSWRGDGRSSCTFTSALIVWFLQGIQSYRRPRWKAMLRARRTLTLCDS